MKDIFVVDMVGSRVHGIFRLYVEVFLGFMFINSEIILHVYIKLFSQYVITMSLKQGLTPSQTLSQVYPNSVMKLNQKIDQKITALKCY